MVGPVPERLYAMRHSAAHVLAAAVLELWPEAKLGIGPVVEHGFYYDFELPYHFTPNDLEKIEGRMRKIIARNETFVREEVSTGDAEALMKKFAQTLKLSLIHELKKKGTTKLTGNELMDVKPGAKTVTLYHTGRFVDLCQGPHIKNTKEIGAFKLTKIAGAYWRGDAKNPMLQRVYGVLFPTERELTKHIKMLEEAEKRDHRKLGRELKLFTFSDLVGPGLPLFTPDGTLVRNLLIHYVTSLQDPFGYELVSIPHLAKADLYRTSGHWEKFRNDLFQVRGGTGAEFVLKPMNCPHHIQLYASEKRSYRDLPVRFAEVTTVYRDEQLGELLGLERVRSITQDDAHVFATPDQITEECMSIITLIMKFYKTFSMPLEARLSLRDTSHPEKYLGGNDVWNASEAALRSVLTKSKLACKEQKGEAAFYGPKIDFISRDSIERVWQLATIQLDFNQPERFKLSYVDMNGKERRPIMIHRAIMGSVERFMAILIEHYGGAFPTWLSPTQVAVMPVGKSHVVFSQKLVNSFQKEGIRARLFNDHETIGYKIRSAEKMKIPYMLVIGDKEKKTKKLTIRKRGSPKMTMKTIQSFIKELVTLVAKRS